MRSIITGCVVAAVCCALTGVQAGPVDNDDCSAAIGLEVGASIEGTTVGATDDGLTESCGTTPSAPGVWYAFLGTGGDVTVSTCNAATYDTKLNVYSGVCGDLVCVGGNDDGPGCAAFSSEVTVPTEVGVEYLVLVNGFNGATGDFTLTVSGFVDPCAGGPPENDFCDGAIELEPAGDDTIVVVSGSTECATVEEGLACPGFTSITAPGVWYRYTTTCDNPAGRLIGSLCNAGTNYDTKIHVFTGACGDLVCVAGNDDLGANCVLNRLYSGFDVPVGDYWILVSGFGDETGEFELTLEEACDCAPAVENDLCIGATPLTLDGDLSATISGDTTQACVFPDPESADCGASSAPGLWYSVEGAGVSMSASTCNQADFDTRISVFSGECGALTCVAENDDNSNQGCTGNTSYVSWVPEEGATYYILVHGFSSASGLFDLTVAAEAPACLELTSCRVDQFAKTVGLDWLGGEGGVDVYANGELVASGVSAPFVDEPELRAGCLNEVRYEIVAGEDCAVSCVAVVSPGAVCLADDFEDYADDTAVELAGYFLVDENTPAEDATWTITNPGGRVNPPTFDGTPTRGKFLVSDSDAAGGSNPPGSGMSHDLWTPSFSTEGKDALWLHVDLSAQLNNNGEAVFDIDVSTDGGLNWTNVFRRVAPVRSTAPLPDPTNADGYFGRLDVDLSDFVGQPDTRLRLRHYEPNDDWWIAIDNLLVDDVPATRAGSTIVFSEDFSGGLGAMSATSLAGNQCQETWHTSDKGGRYNPGVVTERGANRLSEAPGDTLSFVACLNGAQVENPIDTPATGAGSFSYDPDTNELSFEITFSDLSAAETSAHIHAGAPGVSGGVVAPLPAGSPKTGSVTLGDDDEALLLAGELYVNIHSGNHPGGEIRGQILANVGFAILDSDANPDPAEDEWLVTPSLDCSDLDEVELSWRSEIIATGGTLQEVLISLDGGAIWSPYPIFSYNGGGLFDSGEDAFYAERTLKVPDAAGEASVAFAFHYSSGGNNWWWAIDDVVVSGSSGASGGSQRPGDCNQDGNIDISDGVCVFNFLFAGGAPPPCGDGTLAAPGLIALLDWNGDSGVDISDGIAELAFLFSGGPNHVLGSQCIPIEGCPISEGCAGN